MSGSGTITVTFTWEPDYYGELPPQSVILEEDISVSWSVSGTTSGSGERAHGLSSGAVIITSEGGDATRGFTVAKGYTVITGPGTSFSRTANPSANASATVGSNGDSVTATTGVTYTANTHIVELNLAGTTLSGNNFHNILIGQGCSASLSAGPATLSNHQWTVPGRTIDGWIIVYDPVTGLPSRSFVSPTNLTGPSPHWFWVSEDGSPVTVVGTAQASVNGQSIGTVSAQKEVGIWAPWCDLRYEAGIVTITSSGHFGLFGNRSGGIGMDYEGMARTPDLFLSAGTGNVTFTQIATASASWTGTDQVYHQHNENGVTGLDMDAGQTNWWNSGPFPADGEYYGPDDTPAISLSSTAVDAAILFSASTWMMYQPPGADVTWVPLYKFDWDFSGSASGPAGLPGTYLQWLISANGPNLGGKQYEPPYPEWTTTLDPYSGFSP